MVKSDTMHLTCLLGLLHKCVKELPVLTEAVRYQLVLKFSRIKRISSFKNNQRATSLCRLLLTFTPPALLNIKTWEEYPKTQLQLLHRAFTSYSWFSYLW